MGLQKKELAMEVVKDFSSFLMDQIKTNKILNFTAQLTYRVLFACIPACMLIYNFCSWIFYEHAATIYDFLAMLLPNAIEELMLIAKTTATQNQSLSWTTNLFFAVWLIYFTTDGLRAFIMITTKTMKQKETRHPIQIWGVALGYLVCVCVFLFCFVFFILVSIIFIFIGYFLFSPLGIFRFLGNMLEYFFVPMSFAGALTLMYRYALPTPLPFKAAFPGGVFVGLGCYFLFNMYYGLVYHGLEFKSITVYFEGAFAFIVVIYILCLMIALGSVINLYFAKKFFKENHNGVV